MLKPIALIASLLVLAVAAPAAEAKPTFGLADNTLAPFGDARFYESGLKKVRILVPYDSATRGGKRLREQDKWFRLARQHNIEPLISIYRTVSCSHRCAAKRLPSVSSYKKHIRKLRKRYPTVKYWSTWNEINFRGVEPTGKNPVRAAQYYRALRADCRRGPRCTALTGDFRPDGSKTDWTWLKTFKRHAGGGSHLWGLVPHPEINAFHTRYTRKFLRSVRGNVWATEAGAVNFFRPKLRPSTSRQARAMRFMVSKYANVSRRLKRIYVYHWRAASNQRKWDSALTSSSGGRREAYFILFRALGRPAP